MILISEVLFYKMSLTHKSRVSTPFSTAKFPCVLVPSISCDSLLGSNLVSHSAVRALKLAVFFSFHVLEAEARQGRVRRLKTIGGFGHEVKSP